MAKIGWALVEGEETLCGREFFVQDINVKTIYFQKLPRRLTSLDYGRVW
ncbi:uncharacterized protein G2W53_003346 [Senna tora]|uniref:Uncharacterized protein n=1 Tax=Senna tora TaxID=362788 RepID=A0A834XD53_9FABA|nr:uncharacterized protein G2W53_003346 [Senna tora]